MEGVSSFGAILASITVGSLWSRLADAEMTTHWPLGMFFIWNLFGLVGSIAFTGSCWIQKVQRVDARDSESHSSVE
jgi:hypothetical protein